MNSPPHYPYPLCCPEDGSCIAILSGCGNTLQEMLMGQWLWSDLGYLLTEVSEDAACLYPLQSGFHPSYSTQTLLLHCLDKWYKTLDTKRYVGAVFLDISKAFDTVSHKLLLSKLTNLGLSSTATSWFRSYLSNCSQITHVLDSYSSRAFPLLGSPRALSLVPLYFLPSSTTFSLFFFSTRLFSLLMIWPSL